MTSSRSGLPLSKFSFFLVHAVILLPSLSSCLQVGLIGCAVHDEISQLDFPMEQLCINPFLELYSGTVVD